MKLAVVRWYPVVLLLRNALGRFMALRVPRATKTQRCRATKPTILTAQLMLF